MAIYLLILEVVGTPLQVLSWTVHKKRPQDLQKIDFEPRYKPQSSKYMTLTLLLGIQLLKKAPKQWC
jgi:hypothetical protein